MTDDRAEQEVRRYPVEPDAGKVQGNCPMGCGKTLFLGAGGYVTCSWIKCPNPTAVSDLLLDHSEHRHIVVLGTAGYDIEHPIRERLNGELFACPLHAHLKAQDGPPWAPGRYLVHDRGNAGWSWQKAPLPQPEKTDPPVEPGGES